MSTSNQGILFFSNRLEVLFEFLKTNLFTDTTPFSKRLIIVPNRAVERWIHFRLAEDLGIMSGIKTLFLNHAVEILTQTHFPSQFELILRIDREIRQILNEETEKTWEPMIHYVQGKEHRRIQLAKHLALLFARFRIYGKEKLSLNEWQMALWDRLFKDWKEPLIECELKQEVHLFGFAHLSALHFNFFKRACFYQLSPCQEFWSDGSGENRLLTNLGRLDREMARRIEESSLSIQEAYLAPKQETQLARFQTDFLFLRKSEKMIEDDSIQIHVSTTPLREIQNLHHTLLSILNEGKIEPRDILVMAPNIALYEPYIQAVFEDYQIADIPVRKTNSLYQGLFFLLELDRKRWSTQALLELFEHSLFKQKQRWDDHDLEQIRFWVQETGIRWGLDAKHRDFLLQQRHCKGMGDGGATWREGIDHLLEELAIPHEPKRIELTQAELLGELSLILDALRDDLAQLQDEKTLIEWSDYLNRLTENYLESSFRLSEFLPLYPENEKISFQIIELLLKEWIGQQTTTIHANQIQSIRFSSLHPTPAKVICLIGMNHNAFPRQESQFVKNLGPSQRDLDDHLFLEAILSAKEKLLMSYLGRNPFDLSEEPPSSVVSELLPYASAPIVHPARSYDSRYFDRSDERLKNYSQTDFLMAQSAEKRPLSSNFLIHQKEESFTLPEGEEVVDLADLVRCIRSPLRHYFYHAHGIVWREEEEILEDEAFTLSPLRRAILRTKSIESSPEKILQRARRERDFPLGIFGQIAEERLKEELTEFPSLDVIEIKPLRLQISDLLTVILTGKVKGLTSDTLYATDKASFQNAVKMWPLFLASGREKIVFLDKTKERFFEDREPYLRSLLEYYFLCSQQPSLLLPDLIEPILKKEPSKFKPMHWFLNDLNPMEVIEKWYPQAVKLFSEMNHAWFE